MATGADRKLIALGMKTLKLGAKELLALIKKALELLESGSAQDIKMPYEQFQQSGGVPLLNLSPTEKEWEQFAEISRQNDINYTLKLDRAEHTYYLCLQGDEKAIMKALSDYLKQAQEARSNRPSVLAELEAARSQSQPVTQSKDKKISDEKDR